MSATYEVLEPGGHARLVGNVLDRIASASSNPSGSVGSAVGLLADATKEAWTARVTDGNGSALIDAIYGNTLRWNQLVGSDTSSVTVPSGHKYVSYITADSTTTRTLATSDGTAISVTGGTDCIFDLTAMFGAGNEPATVAEFEALYPASYYPYDAGSLLDVEMAGIETVGFNQWDEVLEVGNIDNDTGGNISSTSMIRAKNYTPVFSDTTYYFKCSSASGANLTVFWYDADKKYIDKGYYQNNTGVSPSNAHYMRFKVGTAYGTTYKHDICINISDPARNGEYEPHWSSSLSLPATDLRSAGTVRDELRGDRRITRVGVRAYQSGDENDATLTTDGSTLTNYPLTTPTTTPIDPPLCMSYRTEKGGTERVTVTSGSMSAPPVISARQGADADALRDRALATIAPVEGATASANYAVGSYLVHGGKLYKVTSAIASGESITPGTNVTATTVMAEIVSLTS